MIVRPANLTDKPAWLALRRRLRPALSDQQHERHWLRMMEQRGQRMTLVCVDQQGALLGMIEVSHRGQMEDLGSGPAAYVDALYVEAGEQRDVTARRLADAAAGWAQARGCRLLAADTSLDNQWEQKLHLALGFEEVERKVVYRRVLAAPAADSPAVAGISPGGPLPATQVDAGWMGESGGHDGGARRWPGLVRAAIIVLGIVAFYFTDIFSGDIFRGAVLPIVDAFFVIYLLMLFVGMKYSRKTGAGERQLDVKGTD